jgi:hypothetical protein
VVLQLNNKIQLAGIFFAVAIALAGGYISGLILSLFGRRVEAYADSEEFIDA